MGLTSYDHYKYDGDEAIEDTEMEATIQALRV